MRPILALLIILLCILAISCGLGGGRDPWESVELGTDAQFRDIFFLDARNGWIVGAAGINVTGGIIGRTRDGGQTWQYQSGLISKRYRSTSVDLNAVYFIDAQRGCIAAESGVILLTIDGGASWQRVSEPAAVYAHFQDIDFVDTQNGWIIGRNGVLRTEDGGGSWYRVDESRQVTGDAIEFLDLSRGWLVGKFGKVQRTDDGGVTWEKVAALGNLDDLADDEIPALTAIHFADENHGWIAGYRRELTVFEQHDHAVIIHTSDGGQTWTPQSSEAEVLLTAIGFTDTLRGWAIGYNRNNGTSTVLSTEDSGQTWLVQSKIYGEELRALYVRDGQAWAVGDRVREKPQRLLRLVPPSGDR